MRVQPLLFTPVFLVASDLLMAVFKIKRARSWKVLHVLNVLLHSLSERNACLLMSSRVAQCQNSAPFAGKAALTTRNAHMNFSSMHWEVSLTTFHGNYSS